MSVREGFLEDARASETPSRAPFRRQWAANESPEAVTEPRHAQNQVSKGPAAEMRPPGNRPQSCWVVRFSEAAPSLGRCGGDAKEAESVGRVGRCGDLAGASPVAAAG